MKFKIKDDTNLEELEKFGFEKPNGYYVLFGNVQYEEIIQIFDDGEVYLNIQIYQDKFYQPYVDNKTLEKILSVLFDLIQAEIIEKVED